GNVDLGTAARFQDRRHARAGDVGIGHDQFVYLAALPAMILDDLLEFGEGTEDAAPLHLTALVVFARIYDPYDENFRRLESPHGADIGVGRIRIGIEQDELAGIGLREIEVVGVVAHEPEHQPRPAQPEDHEYPCDGHPQAGDVFGTAQHEIADGEDDDGQGGGFHDGGEVGDGGIAPRAAIDPGEEKADGAYADKGG